jgi:tetratricopeptide (TPR) repeat protein
MHIPAPQLGAMLYQAKQMIQAAFRSNDFDAALRYCNECLKISAMLVEPLKSMETTQMLLRISSIYQQRQDLTNAMRTCEKCLEVADAWSTNAPPTPKEEKLHALEVVMTTYGTKSHLHLNMGQLKEAEACANKACEISRDIYPGKNFRHYRPIRALALVKDKQGKSSEAEELFTEGYRLQQEQNDPLDTDFLQSVEELVAFLMNKHQRDGGRDGGKEETKAIDVAQKHYTSLVEVMEGRAAAPKNKSPQQQPRTDDDVKRDELIFGDVTARLASLTFRRDPAKSEKLMRKVLAVREKNIGADTPPVAVTLVALSEMREVQNDFGPETEALLTRALAIFEKSEGSKSGHSSKISQKIARLRALREGRELPYLLDEDEDIEPPSTSSKKSGSTGSSSASSASSASKPAAASPSSPSGTKPGPKRVPPSIPTFDKNDKDGRKRFEVAVRLLQDDFYAEAYPLAQEAYELFAKEFGEENHNTQSELTPFPRVSLFSLLPLPLTLSSPLSRSCQEERYDRAHALPGVTLGGGLPGTASAPREGEIGGGRKRQSCARGARPWAARQP